MCWWILECCVTLFRCHFCTNWETRVTHVHLFGSAANIGVRRSIGRCPACCFRGQMGLSGGGPTRAIFLRVVGAGYGTEGDCLPVPGVSPAGDGRLHHTAGTQRSPTQRAAGQDIGPAGKCQVQIQYCTGYTYPKKCIECLFEIQI